MKVQQTKDTMTRSLKKLEKQLNKLPLIAYRYFKSVTPKRSGNARRKTKLVRNRIELRYPYGRELDNGSSPQAPNGMTKPTIAYLRKNMKKLLRK